MADRKKAKKSPTAKTTKKQRTAKPAAHGSGVRKTSPCNSVKNKAAQKKQFAADSEVRFRDFFNYSPVSLWEEDISELQVYLASLRAAGVTDLGAYFERHPEEVVKCTDLVRIVAVNSATLEMYEAPDQETLLKGLPRVLTSQSLDAFRDIVLAVSDGAQMYECETVNQTLTGKKLNVLLKWSLINGNGENRNRVLLSVVDISERKRKEEALLESEQRFRAAFENASVGATIVDLSGRFIKVNRFLCELLGYAEEELQRKTFSDVTHPDDVRIGVDYLKRMIRGELEFASFEKRYFRKDGSIVHFIISPSIIRADSGEPKYFVGLYQDITERKKAEDELKASEEKYRFFLEHANDAVLIHSFEETGEPGPFWEVNGLTCKWTGYSREELKCMTPRDLDDPKHQGHIPRVIKKLSTVGHAVFETLWVKKDGGRVPVEISSRTMKIRGNEYVVSLARDITERNRSEQALKKREKQLAESQRIAHIGSWEHNLRTGEIFWSDELFRLLGLDPKKDPGDFKMFFEMIHPDDQPMMKAAIDETLKNKTPFSIDYRFIFRDGRTGIIHAQAELIPDDDGDPFILSGTAQDVTERKLAEERLRESEDRFRSIFEHAMDGIMIGDVVRKRHVEANRAICAMLGYSHDELINLRVEDIHPKGNLPRVLDLFERQSRGEVSTGLDIPMLCKDGSVIYADINSALVTIGGRKYLIGIFRDITERKQSEERIRQSDQFIRSILDTVDEGFIVIDRDYRIITANKAYCDQVGCSSDKVIGMRCYTISHNNSRPCFKEGEDCAVRQVFETGEPCAALHRHRHDGHVIYVETKAFPLRDSSGTISSVIETINNITEKHLLEEERLKTQKLESIGTLAGGIAHDFNNLLQGIFGYISMARMSLNRDKSLSMLGQAEKALQQSVNLTTQLLTFSKGGQPVMKIIDMRPVIENATTFATSGSRSDCRISINHDLWGAVADEGQITQVIQNIVLNADQAMPTGGSIMVSARNVTADAPELPVSLAAREYVAIEISDRGVGIPERYSDKIFDPYFTTKERGSGLGLATSYSIMKKHEGMITVDSSPNMGSTFTIYLPAAKAESAVQPPKIHASPPSSARILVMDDEEIVREVAGELLDALGYSAEFAEHGDAALAKYREASDSGRPFDIVILDLTIRGGMGGMETIQKLLEIDPSVKAVVSSGYSDDPSAAHYEEHGFKAFLKKPYNYEKLMETLYGLL